jgi:hypothetical protein
VACEAEADDEVALIALIHASMNVNVLSCNVKGRSAEGEKEHRKEDGKCVCGVCVNQYNSVCQHELGVHVKGCVCA